MSRITVKTNGDNAKNLVKSQIIDDWLKMAQRNSLQAPIGKQMAMTAKKALTFGLVTLYDGDRKDLFAKEMISPHTPVMFTINLTENGVPQNRKDSVISTGLFGTFLKQVESKLYHIGSKCAYNKDRTPDEYCIDLFEKGVFFKPLPDFKDKIWDSLHCVRGFFIPEKAVDDVHAAIRHRSTQMSVCHSLSGIVRTTLVSDTKNYNEESILGE